MSKHFLHCTHILTASHFRSQPCTRVVRTRNAHSKSPGKLLNEHDILSRAGKTVALAVVAWNQVSKYFGWSHTNLCEQVLCAETWCSKNANQAYPMSSRVYPSSSCNRLNATCVVSYAGITRGSTLCVLGRIRGGMQSAGVSSKQERWRIACVISRSLIIPMQLPMVGSSAGSGYFPFCALNEICAALI